MTTLARTVEEARRILNDEGSAPRFPDEDLVSYVEQGVATMYRIRPDLMVGTDWTPPTYTTVDMNVPLPMAVAQFYWTPLIEWVAAKAELRDAQYSDEGRAAALLSRLNGALLQPRG